MSVMGGKRTLAMYTLNCPRAWEPGTSDARLRAVSFLADLCELRYRTRLNSNYKTGSSLVR